jgi:hypothetical protein
LPNNILFDGHFKPGKRNSEKVAHTVKQIRESEFGLCRCYPNHYSAI